MKICVVTDARKAFSLKLPKCDFAVFPFGSTGEVNYSDELEGRSNFLERFARLTATTKGGALCGCVTDSRGIKRKSVAAAYGGRLLGISDMLSVLDGENFKSGANLGVYDMGGYKVGLCIGSDLYFPDLFKTFSIMGCNLVAVHTEDISAGVEPLLIRAYAYLYGTPVVMSANGVAYFADTSGVAASSNQKVAIFESSPKNAYRQVTQRRKGIACGFNIDY